jgi:hypothetical protein
MGWLFKGLTRLPTYLQQLLLWALEASQSVEFDEKAEALQLGIWVTAHHKLSALTNEDKDLLKEMDLCGRQHESV